MGKKGRRCLVLLYLRSGVTAFLAGKTLHGASFLARHGNFLPCGEVNLKGKTLGGMIDASLKGSCCAGPCVKSVCVGMCCWTISSRKAGHAGVVPG
jgi:hypothetical protein